MPDTMPAGRPEPPEPPGGTIDPAPVVQWRKRHRQPGQVERAVCELLRELAAQVPAGQAIVELGAYQGRSTGWLLLGAQDGHGAHVTTVDPWELYTGGYYGGPDFAHYQQARAEFEEHMARIGATSDVHTVVQREAHLAGYDWQGPAVGLLFHDAEHSVDAVERDLYAWKPHVAPGGVIVLHDAGNPDMGVEAGARRVLDNSAWNWRGRKRMVWRKRSDRRGALIVRKRVRA